MSAPKAYKLAAILAAFFIDMKIVKKKHLMEACRQQHKRNMKKWGASWSISTIYNHIANTHRPSERQANQMNVELREDELLLYNYWHYKVKKCVMCKPLVEGN